MWFRLRFSAESSFLCSTWVKSRFCSWRGIEGTGKAWPLMPEERKSPACRCLDSWDASTTSCPMRPSAHWPSSPQVRQKRPLHILSTTLMNPFNCCPHPFTVIISALCFSFFFSFSEIKGIFVHPFLAERIISMLNYFLQHLAGPKMGALKVKDFSEFDFKPQQLVSDICTIYLNLGYV